jgi:hypothetical protein
MAAAILASAFAYPAQAQWTGCGMGAGGSYIVGSAWSGDVGLSTNGEKAGVTLNCDWRLPHSVLVIGGEANYDWIFGSAEAVGFKNEYSFLARAGALTSNTNLVYVAGGWGQMDSNYGKGSNWKLGLGDEFRIANSPLYMDLRLTYTRFDADAFGGLMAGVTKDAFEGGLRLKLKFGPGMMGGTGPLFTTEDYPVEGKGSDPKLSAPKR